MYTTTDIRDTDIAKLKVGDYIVYSKEVKPLPTNFTLGKRYKILDKKFRNPGYNSQETLIQITKDDGNTTWIHSYNGLRRWSCL
jgi:hypothetical protein